MLASLGAPSRKAVKPAAEDHKGFRLMERLGHVSSEWEELKADELKSGTRVLLSQGPPAPCGWGTIPEPIEDPDLRPKSYTSPISQDDNGDDQFRLVRTASCTRILADLRRDTDFGQERWVGGLWHNWGFPGQLVQQ